MGRCLYGLPSPFSCLRGAGRPAAGCSPSDSCSSSLPPLCFQWFQQVVLEKELVQKTQKQRGHSWRRRRQLMHGPTPGGAGRPQATPAAPPRSPRGSRSPPPPSCIGRLRTYGTGEDRPLPTRDQGLAQRCQPSPPEATCPLHQIH